MATAKPTENSCNDQYIPLQLVDWERLTVAKAMHPSSHPICRRMTERVNRRKNTTIPGISVNVSTRAFTRVPAVDAMKQDY